MDEPSDKDALNLLYCDDDEFEEAIGISVPTSDAVSEVLNLLKAPEDIQLLTSVDQLLGAADVGKGIAMREKKEPLSAKRPTTVEDSAPSSLKKESTFDTGPSKSRSVIPTVFDRMESVKGERSCMGRLKAWQDSGVTVEVRTRNQSEIRSTVQGKLIAFDKFWNLMLSNVSEVLQRRMNPREPMFTPASSSRSANLEKILAREMEVLSIVKSRGNVTLGKCRHMKNLAACFDSIKEKRAVIKREVPGLMFITGENVVLVREVSSEKAVYKIVTYINVMPDDKEKPMTNGNHNWEVSNGNTGDAVSEGLILEPYKEIRNLIQHSISIGEISLDKSVTHPTTEFDRFISVWNLVNIRYYKIPDVDLQKKCRKLNAVSQIQRNHGNCLMKSRKLGAALEAFNRAILTAEFGARSMCLALYGRSRVFQARKRYQRALDDIRYSLSWAVRHPNGNLQDDLVKKLRAAEKEYLSEVVPDAKAALNSQTNLSLKSQLQEREFPVEWSSDYLPTAARDIKAVVSSD
ncbi:unnamed protein product [Cyprideis torosa]|uniref:Uncharacterized protein n=1 Tax=Cyprideis torosa TaxID=163714 RepID=A0A7R8ZQR1_9CRUS|nr:unnamed protein product [Cyprideis torosa]CAG0891289.1 unnamed protein product [Cyprideis torosa]